MNSILPLRKIYQLKNVERWSTVKNRKESSAEHSWSCLVLADFFLSTMKNPPNRLRVYELLLYHDLVEIEVGDTVLHPKVKSIYKEDIERKGMHTLAKQLPTPTKEHFLELFTEFLDQKTAESKFARAIDIFDAELHEMDYKDDWKGWSEAFLRSKKKHLFKEFPEVDQAFEETTQYARDHGYFQQ
jgi:putative hydrolase of HD superfamily